MSWLFDKLVSNPGRVLLRSLSMWCVYLAGLAEVVPYIVPYLDDYIPRWLSVVFLVLAPLARVIPQRKLHADQ